MKFDTFTVFLLKCGIIPPWEIKLRAYAYANDIWDGGGAPARPILPKDTRETWVERNWTAYIKLATNSIRINRPRW